MKSKVSFYRLMNKNERKEYIDNCKSVKVTPQDRLDNILGWCNEHKNHWPFRPVTHVNKENFNKYHREYRNKNVKNLLTSRMRSLINSTVRHLNKNIMTERISLRHLKYNTLDLIKRLNKTMPKGYTWQDFLDGELDIDHIKPVVLFNYESPEDKEFQECWALKNLRLLTIYDNRSRKFNKIKGVTA